MSASRRVGAGILLTLSVGLLAAGVLFRQNIADQLAFWSYEPTSEMAQVASRSGLSKTGVFYLYAANPALVGAEEFNVNCQRAEQSSPILGCYNLSSNSVHIYDIDSDELDGIKEVTAAHEMLHVVYARLSDAQAERLTGQLEAAYQRLKTPKLEERMGYYERNEPGSRINELHSIIPTEFADIGAELEAYYATYFSDRQQTVALHASYSQRFEEIEREAKTLSESLERRADVIDRMRGSYEADMQQLNQDILAFNRRAESGGFSSQQSFNQQRDSLESRSQALVQRQNSIVAMIDEYNRDVERLQALGGQMERLNSALDSLEAVN